MRGILKTIVIPVVLIASVAWIPACRLFAKDNPSKQAVASASSSRESGQQTGEQIFMENCSRCHKPPMTIPPRITGTIVMHMRVRAKLSRQDEQLLLRYLAP